MKKLLLGLLILVVVDVLVFFALKGRGNDIAFKTEKVVRGDIEETVSATGTLNPVGSVAVGTQVSGTVRDVYADFNSRVREGQLLAQIEPTPFDAQVQQAKASLAAAKASLEKARAKLLDARRTLTRHKELYAKSFISKSTLETSETNHEIAQAEAHEAEAQVAQAEAALRYATNNLMATRIRSPIDGVVVSRNVSVGQTVVASFQSPTLFVIARDLKKMQIDTKVEEADIGKVSVYQQAVFTVDTYPETVFRGMVSQIRNAPTLEQNVVAYDVIVMVDNPDLRLKPGMTANVSLIVASKKDVLMIPNSALRFKPPEGVKTRNEQKGPGVWILEDGLPRHIEVTAGISNGNYTEVVSGDLQEGQEVIVAASRTKEDRSQPGTPQGL